MEIMYVIKRDGAKERVSFDKVSRRLETLVEGNEQKQKTSGRLYFSRTKSLRRYLPWCSYI